jgi:hypothetical protein
MAEEAIRVGRRVWVRDPTKASGRSFGRIVSIPTDLLTGNLHGFVVKLDRSAAVVTCNERGRGEQWDFAN